MQKTIDAAIDETAEKIAQVINESGLPVSILVLLLSNTVMQLQQAQASAKAHTEESDNAESES